MFSIPLDLGHLLSYGGALGVLMFVVIAFMTGQLHSKPEWTDREQLWQSRYDEMKEARDEWQSIAKEGIRTAQQAASAAEIIREFKARSQ